MFELDRERHVANCRLAELEELTEQLGLTQEALDVLEQRLGTEGAAWAIREEPQELGRDQPSSLERWPLMGMWVRRRRLRRERARILAALAMDWAALGWPAPSEANLDRCYELIRQAASYASAERRRRELQTALAKEPDQHAALSIVVARNEAIQAAASKLVKEAVPAALDLVSEENLARLRELQEALTLRAFGAASDSNTREAWLRYADAILGTFPLWAVTNLAARRRIPMQPGIFDLVIIDEASQCDIASALPLLARAKRAMIVGDPNQLSHITSMPPVREGQMLARQDILGYAIKGYSFTQNSLFQLADRRPDARRHLLRDHFRCHGDIADFISATFYGGRLHGLRQQNSLRPPPGQRPGLHWTDVRGAIEGAQSGCHAPAELEAILSQLEQVLVRDNFEGTVGVVTPFRQQAIRISDAIARRIPAEKIEAADLIASTAHQFQGDARDLILLSPCVGPGTPPGSLNFLRETPYLINVAVSRARAVCRVFGNLEAARQSNIGHITALVRAAAGQQQTRRDQARFESPWEERLYRALRERELTPLPQYAIAGRRLDLALIRDDVLLDVEVDGDRYHRDADGRRRSADLWRDLQLRSLGWKVLRFWVYELKENMDGCVERVVDALGRSRAD